MRTMIVEFEDTAISQRNRGLIDFARRAVKHEYMSIYMLFEDRLVDMLLKREKAGEIRSAFDTLSLSPSIWSSLKVKE